MNGQSATEQSRNKVHELVQKANLYRKVGRFAAAEELLRQAIDSFPDFANLHLQLALVYHQQSNFYSAITSLETALTINSDYCEAGLALAVIFFDLGLYEQGQATYQGLGTKREYLKSPQVLGAIANHHAKTGRQYQQLNMANQAILEYKKALHLFPHMPDVKINLAKIYLELEQFDHAAHELNEILHFKDDHGEAHTMLGIVHFKRGHKRIARDHWLKAQQRSPNDQISRAYLQLSS